MLAELVGSMAVMVEHHPEAEQGAREKEAPPRRPLSPQSLPSSRS